MNYVAPALKMEQRDLTRDEWWWIGMILLFVIRVYSNYSLEKAVQECTNSGGTAKVESHFFGSSWTVNCYKK